MGRRDETILSGGLTTRLSSVVMFAITFLLTFLSARAAEKDVTDLVIKNFKTADYDVKSGKLRFILSGKNARKEGVNARMKDLKLDLMSNDGKKVKAIITAPEAVFDRSRKVAFGDKEVHLRASNISVDGVGFDASESTRRIHIHSQVKVIINADNPLFAKGESNSAPRASKAKDKTK